MSHIDSSSFAEAAQRPFGDVAGNQSSGVTNVEVVRGTEQSPNLPDKSIDLAIMVDVYHELKFPHEMLQAIKRSLKSDGKILLLEYRAEDASIAIKPHHKMTEMQASKEMMANGFNLAYDGGSFCTYNIFCCTKKSSELYAGN